MIWLRNLVIALPARSSLFADDRRATVANIMIFPTLFYVNRVNESVALCFIPINTFVNGIVVRNCVRSPSTELWLALKLLLLPFLSWFICYLPIFIIIIISILPVATWFAFQNSGSDSVGIPKFGWLTVFPRNIWPFDFHNPKED